MKLTKNPMAAAALISAVALAVAGCSSESEAEPEELVLGLVPSQEIDQLIADGDELAALLSAELDMPVSALVTDSSYSALVVAMQTGQADIGMFGPIALVQSVDQADAVPILQSVRYGASTYVTQWMTNDPDRFCMTDVVIQEDEGVNYSFCNGTEATTDGPLGEDAIALIEQDESISFVDESSASGYYYPATQLGELGLDPLALDGAFFAGGHPNSVLSVYNGDATVGTSFNDARTSLTEEHPDLGEKVVVFGYSPNIPNDGISVRGDLSEELQQRIKDAFLALTESEEGLAALDAVYEIEDLVPADLDALDVARQVEANFGDE